MTAHAVRIELPEGVFAWLQERAARSRRTVEDELVDVVANAAYDKKGLSEKTRAEMNQLAALDDAALWKAARTRVSGRAAAKLERLNYKRQSEGLTEDERRIADDLLRQQERVMLLRAQAAVLLQQRGHDIAELAHPA